jgi:hypothetical protein
VTNSLLRNVLDQPSTNTPNGLFFALDVPFGVLVTHGPGHTGLGVHIVLQERVVHSVEQGGNIYAIFIVTCKIDIFYIFVFLGIRDMI